MSELQEWDSFYVIVGSAADGQACTAVEGFIFEDGYCRNFRVPTMQQWVNELHEAATTQSEREDRLGLSSSVTNCVAGGASWRYLTTTSTGISWHQA